MKLSVVGGVMVGGTLSSSIERYQYGFLSNEVRKLLEADFVFCNLECVLARTGTPPEKIRFYSTQKKGQ